MSTLAIFAVTPPGLLSLRSWIMCIFVGLIRLPFSPERSLTTLTSKIECMVESFSFENPYHEH
jgi:hypothetical protein